MISQLILSFTAPSAPRICEELCTQSHDKVMIQWRSPDHLLVDMYELQYAVGNNEVGRLEWISPPKSNNWMVRKSTFYKSKLSGLSFHQTQRTKFKRKNLTEAKVFSEKILLPSPAK